MAKRKRHAFPPAAALALLALAAVAAIGAAAWFFLVRGNRGPADVSPPKPDDIWEVTAYCNCGKCCDWEPDGSGRPVHSKGPLKGKPKEVGRTASGRMAHRGTVAADTRVLPFGTRLRVEGYGECVVEDRGGAIKGRHIDLWFPTHEEARAWGSRRMPVEIIGRGGADGRNR